jgi:small subunit ribosomal protein S4
VLTPKWLSFDAQNLTGTVAALPTREDIDLQVQENMIVEYYSR